MIAALVSQHQLRMRASEAVGAINPAQPTCLPPRALTPSLPDHREQSWLGWPEEALEWAGGYQTPGTIQPLRRAHRAAGVTWMSCTRGTELLGAG